MSNNSNGPTYLAASFTEADYPCKLQVYFDKPPSNDIDASFIQIDLPSSGSVSIPTKEDVKEQIVAGLELGGVENYHMRDQGIVLVLWFQNNTDVLLAKASLTPDKPCNVLFQDMSAPGTTKKMIENTAADLQDLFNELGFPTLTSIPDFEKRAIRLHAAQAIDFIDCIGQMRSCPEGPN